MRCVQQDQRGKSGIIYRNSRSKVEDTAARLQSRGISAAAYHAGLEKRRSCGCAGEISSATICRRGGHGSTGMGINKPNVRFVGALRHSP